ncbi:hypothetical protein [Vibrio sp. DNB22_12_1]|uniref:hypothetical protein n=1 Tax=unclassified Vibrio TaxID=2614977 RepID=UPI00406A88A6
MHIEPIRLFAHRNGNDIEIIDKETGEVQKCYPEHLFTEDLALAEYKAVYLRSTR